MSSAIKAFSFLMVCTLQAVAFADAPGHDDLATKWKVNDEDPMSSIPSVEDRNKDPLEFGYFLQDVLMRAEGAYREQDWKNAVKYYRPLAAAVPDVARSHSRLCDAYARMGEVQPAIDSCRTAVGLKGARVIDHVRLVDLLLRRSTFGATDADDVVASLDHLREHARLHPQALPGTESVKPAVVAPVVRTGWNKPPDLATPKPDDNEHTAKLRERALQILEGDRQEPERELAAGGMHLPTQIELSSCRLAVRTGDNARLTECMARLQDYKLPAKLMLPFQWADALQRKDEQRARALLEQARQLGTKDDIIAGMLVEQEKVLGTDWRARLTSSAGLMAVLGGVIALLVLSLFGRRLTRSRIVSSAEA